MAEGRSPAAVRHADGLNIPAKCRVAECTSSAALDAMQLADSLVAQCLLMKRNPFARSWANWALRGDSAGDAARSNALRQRADRRASGNRRRSSFENTDMVVALARCSKTWATRPYIHRHSARSARAELRSQFSEDSLRQLGARCARLAEHRLHRRSSRAFIRDVCTFPGHWRRMRGDGGRSRRVSR